MPFDKLDKKAREAAEQYNAEYNEEAWSKMEALLDKHMPVGAAEPETKKRKFQEKWLFLLLGLFAVSSVILLIKPWQSKNENKAAVENTAPGKPVEDNPDNKSAAINPRDNSKKNVDSKSTHIYTSTKKANETSVSAAPNNNSAQKNYLKNNRTGNGALIFKNNGTGIDDIESGTERTGSIAQSQNADFQGGFINQKIDNGFIWNKNIIANKISVSNVLPKSEPLPTKTKNVTDMKKNRFANSFSVSLSAGPDISAINVNNVGTFEILYGAGIGYKFANHWQVRTGFYTTKKVYNANPGDYNPPSMFWNYYPYLEDISADCKVNEIPLIINYSFGQNKKRVWFVSGGISSYFMKRETYDYHSKNPTGGYSVKSYTIYNANKHYLSSLRLSTGYERTLNKTISFTAEPYINLPLSGIGYGKVKLNSAGLLFSVNAKPFAKK